MIKLCLLCDEEVIARRADAKYCSRRCRQTASKRSISFLRRQCICRVCGKGFVAQRQSKDACSNACYLWGKRNPDRPRTLERACMECGRTYARRHDALYCSPPCQQSAASKRRRARKSGAIVGLTASKSELLERSGGLCMLCDGVIDLDLTWPDPHSLSIDHIVPLALGGDHSAPNLQATHLVCNLRKGAQLELAR